MVVVQFHQAHWQCCTTSTRLAAAWHVGAALLHHAATLACCAVACRVQVLMLVGADVLERCMSTVRQLKGITATYRMTAKGPPVRHSHYVAGERGERGAAGQGSKQAGVAQHAWPLSHVAVCLPCHVVFTGYELLHLVAVVHAESARQMGPACTSRNAWILQSCISVGMCGECWCPAAALCGPLCVCSMQACCSRCGSYWTRLAPCSSCLTA